MSGAHIEQEVHFLGVITFYHPNLIPLLQEHVSKYLVWQCLHFFFFTRGKIGGHAGCYVSGLSKLRLFMIHGQ